jgi:transposase
VVWLRSFGELDRVGVESTGSYAAGLTRHLLAERVRVLEVNQPHAHTRRRRGKTDAIDAEMAARHALSLSNPVIPKQTTGIVEAIRQLRVARESAVKSRSVAMVQLGDLILTAPSDLREQLATRKSLKGKAALCRRLRPDADAIKQPTNAAKFALRSLARRITVLDDEIAELDAQLQPLVATAAPRTTALLGISTGHAGQLLVTAGQNIDRLKSEGAFAALCGASPIPIASGKHGRYRLNPGGDRQANRALHLIAVCRLRYCPRTRNYAARRTTEGKTKKEIMRCLKRYIARELYRSLRADLADHQPMTRPITATSITCGAGFIGRRRRTELAP